MRVSGADLRTALATRLSPRYFRHPAVTAVAMAHGRDAVLAARPERPHLGLHVYLTDDLPLSARASAAADGAGVELDSAPGEAGDGWLDSGSGCTVSVVFRRLSRVEESVQAILVRHEAALGRTTCLLHSVRSCIVLDDRDGLLRRLQVTASQPYPEGLRMAIVSRNRPVLRGMRFSHAVQLEEAVLARDAVTVNAVVGAVLASVFDILFAVNRLPHPSGPDLLGYAEQECRILPRHLGNLVGQVVATAARPGPAVRSAVTELLDALDELLILENLMAAPVVGRWAPR